ncbi:MAG: hypothetical protein WC639_04685 [Patescibacteria group bacterium]|jgi:hypothetical protein
MSTEITNKSRAKRAVNPNSLKNLKPFTKGNHASAGRPKKQDCLIGCIKEELERITANGRTNEQLIADALTRKAISGDLKAIEILMSYTTPKPAQAVDLGSNADKPLIIRIIEDGNNS